jgi:hypothetical protein
VVRTELIDKIYLIYYIILISGTGISSNHIFEEVFYGAVSGNIDGCYLPEQGAGTWG